MEPDRYGDFLRRGIRRYVNEYLKELQKRQIKEWDVTIKFQRLGSLLEAIFTCLESIFLVLWMVVSGFLLYEIISGMDFPFPLLDVPFWAILVLIAFPLFYHPIRKLAGRLIEIKGFHFESEKNAAGPVPSTQNIVDYPTPPRTPEEEE